MKKIIPTPFKLFVTMISFIIYLIFASSISYSSEKPSDGRLVIKERVNKNAFTLEDCINIAMANSITLKHAKKQLELAKFRILEARRNLGPKLTAKWEESGGKVDGRHYEGRKFLIEGKQPIFYGGELVNSVKQARVNLEITRNDYERIKNEVILQVKKAYYGLDKAKKALGIQKRLYERTKKLYDSTRRGYEVETISKIEFLKVTSQYNQVEYQYISAQEDLYIAKLILQQAMNIDSNEGIDIVEVDEPESILDVRLETCYMLAHMNRPELKISQLSIDYFNYEKKIASARASWPRVDFITSYGRAVEQFVKQDRSTSDHKRGMNPEYYAGVIVKWPFFGNTIGYTYTKEKWAPVVRTVQGTEAYTSLTTISLFDKFPDITGLKEARADYVHAQDEFNKKKQEVELEIKEAFFRYKKSIILMKVAKSKILFQSKQVEILDIRRELGEANISDVIEENIKLAEEEYGYIQAISDYYTSIASLNKAIGIDGYF